MLSLLQTSFFFKINWPEFGEIDAFDRISYQDVIDVLSKSVSNG